MTRKIQLFLSRIDSKTASVIRRLRTVSEDSQWGQPEQRSRPLGLPNWLMSCNWLQMPDQWVNNVWAGIWRETAGLLTPSFTLVLGTGSWNVSSIRPPRRVAEGHPDGFVCPSQRKWFVLCGWQPAFVPESEATMRASRGKPLTVIDEVKQSRPLSLGLFPHSCLPG